MAENQFAAGDTIDRVYQLGRLLGRGGMGQVFSCEHLELKQQYAMKILSGAAFSQEHWQRFQAEAKALARLHHPSIVGIHNMGVHQGTCPYYVMDLLEGETLDAMVRRNGRLPVNEALGLTLQLASALSQAHNIGIIHRDIKPANIIIDKNRGMTAHIVDFGIARLQGGNASLEEQQQTAAGSIFGTPAYMSPEQSAGKPVDARTDIYSLGCTLVELLTGRQLFTGESAFALISKHQNEKPPTLQELAPNGVFSQQLQEAVNKMLAKDPAARYATMKQVGIDLTRILKGKAIFNEGAQALVRGEKNEEGEAGQAKISDGGNDTAGDASNFTSSNVDSGSGVSLDFKFENFWRPGLQVLGILAIIAVLAHFCISSVWSLISPSKKPTVTARLKADNLSSLIGATDGKLPVDVVSCNKKIDAAGEVVRRFNFPTDFAVGYIRIDEDAPFAVSGVVEVPITHRVTLCLQQSVSPYPDILRKFGNDDIYGLEIITDNAPRVLELLKPWTALRELSFFNNYVRKKSFNDSHLTRDVLPVLDHMMDLDSVGLCGPEVTCSDVLALELSNRIKTLKIKNMPDVKLLVDNLSKRPNIKELVLVKRGLTDEDLTGLAVANEIEKLAIYRGSLTPGSVKIFSKMPALKKLILDSDWSPVQKARFKQALPRVEFERYGKLLAY